jgi:hypothetical protein
MDFLNVRVGVEVGFVHSHFVGIDYLKFQVASCSGLNQIDVGAYVMTTRAFSEKDEDYCQNWQRFSAFALQLTLA